MYIKPHRPTLFHLVNHNRQPIMSYDQGNRGPRRDFNDDSNYDAPIDDQRTVPGGDSDSALSESYGGSGTGQAGGYEGRTGRQGQQGLDQGDEYCDTDPGMAGNRSGQGIQDVNVPRAGQPGGGYDSAYGQSIGGDGRSRGYERDTDEYDDSGIGSGQAAGAGTGRGPTSKLSSMGSKFTGEAEKMAGKLSNDPSLQAKGEQRKTGF
ncbi:hypothetical protein EV424DRAFT_1395535 [Suillus variegatus]|nr:hypothetical protein EV424DRAFT_1395535 [Suillus variegatus]